MYLDSCLYKDFHNYIDAININRHYLDREYLDSVNSLKCLYSREIPEICIHKYIDHIVGKIYKDDTHIDGLFINIIAIIKRVIKHVIVNKYNIHRLIATTFMISQKIYDDLPYNNEAWAHICGVSLESINRMEIDILKCLDYNIFIKHEEMMAITKSIKYVEH